MGNSTARPDIQCATQVISVFYYECGTATPDECPATCKDALQELEALGGSDACGAAVADAWVADGNTAEEL